MGRVKVATPRMLEAIDMMNRAKKNGDASPKLDKVATMVKTHLSILLTTLQAQGSGVSNKSTTASPHLCAASEP